MKIETKFNIGDLIYSIESINIEEICSLCKGSCSIIDTKDKCAYLCPKCEGYGILLNGRKLRVIGPYKIIGCSIVRGYMAGKLKIEPYDEKYYVDNLDNYKDSPNYTCFECTKKYNKIFKTKEEAQRYCKNRNRQKK